MVFCVHPINFLAGDNNAPAAEDQKALRSSLMELRASRISMHAIKAGDLAPDFRLVNTEGDEVNSVDLVRKGPVIIIFFRGMWCWYSYATLVALEKLNDSIINKGISLVAISPQLHFSKLDMDRRLQLTFPILCDAQCRIGLEFRVAWRLSGPLKKKYFALGADLDRLHGTDCKFLPMASLFVIDRQGTVVYSDVNADYTQLINTEELFVVLDNMPPLRRSRAME